MTALAPLPSAHRAPLAPPASPIDIATSAPPGGPRVPLAEVLGALSHALDLTDGQPPGHTLRTCLVGMRLAEELGVPAHERQALYYALLLKDAGCSSNASRMAAVFGSDDRAIKPPLRAADRRPLPMLRELVRNVGRGRAPAARLRQLLRVAGEPGVAREIIQIRCDRGAAISRRLGFPEPTASAIRSLDEHWNGRGYPDGLRGDAIPLLSRIVLLAQTVEVFFTERGVEAAFDVVRARRGSWFDPRLVDHVLRWRRDGAWWASLRGPDVLPQVVHVETADGEAEPATIGGDGIDEIARAFADIIDAKSPFTFRHSANVASLARGAIAELGADEPEARRVHRAGLLHDIGKLGVSNLILDKPGRLDADERRAIERHPVFTWEVLSRVGAFGDIARTAALHHERLDGSGYPWNVGASELDEAARVLAVADVYEAVTADRPYRAGMASAEARALLERGRDTHHCSAAMDALFAYVERVDWHAAARLAAGGADDRD